MKCLCGKNMERLTVADAQDDLHYCNFCGSIYIDKSFNGFTNV